MNRCLTRVLGGVACTIGVLALGMGTAHADEKDQGGGLVAKVAVHAKTKSNVAAHKGAVSRVRVTVPRARVHVRPARSPAVRERARANIRPRASARVAVRAHVAARTRPAVRVRTNARVHTRPAVRVRTTNARVHTRPAVRVRANAAAPRAVAVRTNARVHTRPAVRARANAAARRAVAVRTNARVHTRPAVRATANAHARAVGIPVQACVRINAGDCADAGTGPANRGSGRNSAVVPVITGDANATVDRLVDAAICLRVNAGGCGTGGAGAANTTGSAVPSVIGDVAAQAAGIPVNACVRINAGDCGNGTDPAGGTDPNRALPTIGSDVTLAAGELADGVVCLRINGGDCGGTAGSSDPTGSGPGSDPAGTPGGSDSTGSGAGPDRGGVDPARYARLGAEADRFGGDGSVMGTFASAAPVATVGGTIRFSDGVLPGRLFGGEVWPVTGRSALDPAGNGKSSQLAHTGSGAAMLPLLIGGLLSLLMAGPLLARRRRN